MAKFLKCFGEVGNKCQYVVLRRERADPLTLDCKSLVVKASKVER